MAQLTQPASKARSVPRYNLPELAHLNAQIDPLEEQLDYFYPRTKNLLSMATMVLAGILGFVLLWNVKMQMGIDILPGAHHDFIDGVNKSLGIASPF